MHLAYDVVDSMLQRTHVKIIDPDFKPMLDTSGFYTEYKSE